MLQYAPFLSATVKQMRLILPTLTMLLAIASGAQGKMVITTIPPPFKTELTSDYFISLLRLSLDNTIDEFGPYQLQFTPPMYSTPALLDLARSTGKLDVVWSGSNNKREKLLNPIRIPLIRGALGIRSALMHKRITQSYKSVDNLEKLRQFSVCQGQFWPDSDILEANGVEVKRYKNFEPMIDAVYRGDCDIFLRGIHEAPSEIEQRLGRYPDLALVESTVISYPLPMYFFVGKHNPTLHRRISAGLSKAIEDGSLQTLMETHPITSHLFPLSKWRNSTAIKLHNPFLDLPDEYQNDYWLKLGNH